MAEETYIEHPNRDKAGSKAAKAVIVLLMLVTAGLVLIITVGGWSVLQGAQIVAFGYIGLYVIMAFYVARWNRGLLPVAAALSVLLAVVAGVAAPGWFARDKAGFEDPSLAPEFLGMLTIILIPVSVLLVVFAMRGFAQKWNVEIERHTDDYHGDTAPAGA